MRNLYAIVLTESEFRWLRAWINAGVSPEPESSGIHRKIEDLAGQDNKQTRKAA